MWQAQKWRLKKSTFPTFAVTIHTTKYEAKYKEKWKPKVSSNIVGKKSLPDLDQQLNILAHIHVQCSLNTEVTNFNIKSKMPLCLRFCRDKDTSGVLWLYVTAAKRMKNLCILRSSVFQVYLDMPLWGLKEKSSSQTWVIFLWLEVREKILSPSLFFYIYYF